jgi:hypothetical protein
LRIYETVLNRILILSEENKRECRELDHIGGSVEGYSELNVEIQAFEITDHEKSKGYLHKTL